MRITYFYAENMAGIKAGSGLNKIEIDFTKNNNSPFTLLVGNNGGGKSTLLSLLQPFRETNDGRNPVIEGEKAYKEIHIQNNKDEYVIKHTWKPNKSYIFKNGEDLNESGSIKLFNQIMKDELELDEEYFKIARLGSNVTNFIDLTSGARKTYVGNFMPYIDDYLTLYSEVKKTYTILNREFNNISTQLDKFPDYDTLKEKRDSLKNQFDNLNKNLNKYNKKYTKLEESIVSNERIFKEKFNIEYNENNIKEIKDDLNDLYIYKTKCLNKYKKEKLNVSENENYENILDVDINEIKSVSKFKELISDLNLKEKDLEIKYNDYFNKINNIKEKIDIINKDLEIYYNSKSIDYEYELDRLETNLKELINKYESLNEEVPEGFKDDDIDVLEFGELVNAYSRIYDEIYSLKNNTDITNINLSLYNKYNKKEIENKYNDLIERKEDLNNQLNYLNNNYDLLKTLDKKPEKCNNSKCSFISKALDFKKEYDKYESYEKEFNKIIKEIDKYSEILDMINHTSTYITKVNEIFNRLIKYEENLGTYHKYDEFDKYCNDFKLFLNEFMERDLSFIQDCLNLDKEYNYYKQYQSIKNYKKNIDDNNSKIKSLKKEQKDSEKTNKLFKDKEKLLNKLEDDLYNNKSKLEEIENDLNHIKKCINELNYIIDTLKEIKSIKDEIENNEEKMESFKKFYKENKETYEQMDELNEEISDIEYNIKSFEKDLESTNKDLNYIEILLDNKSKLDKNFKNTKFIRDALDPKKGIPLIFIEKFLDKIEVRTNELLDIAYGSDFRIKFDITDKDFFIKVFKTFSDLEDISQASQGETSLTTLSLSLAMMQYMVKKYNILYLDEIDGTLSTANKRIFLSMLEKQIEELDLEQVFIITHNNEFYSYPVNLILFNLDETDIDTNDSDFMDNKSILFNLEEYKREVDGELLVNKKKKNNKKS